MNIPVRGNKTGWAVWLCGGVGVWMTVLALRLVSGTAAAEALKLSGSGAEHFQQALRHEAAGELDQAIAAYERYLAEHENIAYAYYYLGNAYFDLGEKEKGLAQFKKAAEACPG